jgi:mannose-1-phosphate guanylyltransferase
MTALPCYVFRPEILNFLDRLTPDESTGERALPVLIQMMIDSGETVGAITLTPPRGLRSLPDLLAANLALLRELPASVLFSDVPSSVTVHPPVYVEAGVKIGEGAVIGPNVFLEKGSLIGPRVHLEDSIVLGVRVGNEKRITGEVIFKETL